MSTDNPFKLVILSSGFGSNLQAIIDKLHLQHNIEVRAVVSDTPSESVQRALRANIPCLFLPKHKKQSRENYDQRLTELIAPFQPDLIVLSGFMRILSSTFIHQYEHKVINIHPSLLPKHKGLNTHQRVIDAKDREHGTTIHYVDESLDGGKIIAQKRMKVLPFDTAATLEQTVKALEHELYPTIIQKLALKARSVVLTKGSETNV
ncbi:phosphoribosylglycinamide formyltransferase [Caedibacter taeniospiralis]|uniref:phosphoribosylglycinamide formyltransferase n=1 Tax=Caedibacter taeniospiralis TaxID=28907 RepID=UPI000C26F004|nr:phosphoribosylglycinamide formyltransferase [Caedibacter taeniospiralis]